MIVVNLQQIGPVAHRFCTREELMAVYQAAAEIIDTTESEILAEILTEWETALTWRSLDPQPVDEEWYYRALLLTCCRGLRGEIAPQFYTINRDS